MTDQRKPVLETFVDALQVFVLEVEIQQRIDRVHGHPRSSSAERVLASAQAIIEMLRRAQRGAPGSQPNPVARCGSGPEA